jgi:hypothetical protein
MTKRRLFGFPSGLLDALVLLSFSIIGVAHAHASRRSSGGLRVVIFGHGIAACIRSLPNCLPTQRLCGNSKL